MTLHFPGPVGEERIARLRELGDSLVLPAFELVLDRIGCWPRPAVLWAGPPAAPGPLQAFHAQLEDGLEAAGFEREARAYRPHVTLARKVCRAPQDPGFRPVRWAVREWALVESRAGERPLYHPLARWPAKKIASGGGKQKENKLHSPSTSSNHNGGEF